MSVLIRNAVSVRRKSQQRIAALTPAILADSFRFPFPGSMCHGWDLFRFRTERHAASIRGNRSTCSSSRSCKTPMVICSCPLLAGSDMFQGENPNMTD